MYSIEGHLLGKDSARREQLAYQSKSACFAPFSSYTDHAIDQDENNLCFEDITRIIATPIASEDGLISDCCCVLISLLLTMI